MRSTPAIRPRGTFYARAALMFAIALGVQWLAFNFVLFKTLRAREQSRIGNEAAAALELLAAPLREQPGEGAAQWRSRLQLALLLPGVREAWVVGSDGSLIAQAGRERGGVSAPAGQLPADAPLSRQVGDVVVHVRPASVTLGGLAGGLLRDLLLIELVAVCLGLLLVELRLRPALTAVRSLTSFAEHFGTLDAGRATPLNAGEDFERLAGALALASDELARRRDSLETTSRQLHELLDASLDGVVRIDRQGRITSFNSAAQRMFGMPEDRALGLRMADLVIPAQARQASPVGVERATGADLAGTIGQRVELAARKADGSGFPVELGIARIGSETDPHFIGFIRDITERRRQDQEVSLARAAAERAEQRLRSAIAALDEGFVLFDADDRLVLCNQRFREIYREVAHLVVEGVGYEALLRGGVGCGQFPQSGAAQEQWIAERLRLHSSGNFLVEEQLPSGRWIRVTEARTADGGTVGFRVDISEIKVAWERAQAASRAMGEFLANTTHEIRTPLNGVIGITQLVLDTPLNGEQREYLTLARMAADDLAAIVDDVLDFSKIEAGHMGLERAPFRLLDSTRGVVETMRLRAERKGLSFSSTHDFEGDPVLIGDAGRIRQILNNLLGNAIKFTDRGGVDLRIGVAWHAPATADRLAQVGVQLRFEITDTGVGIPDDLRPLLFEPFRQGDASVSRKYGGTGLGLTICKRLVEAMEGTIEFSSAVGQGTTFKVCLPLTQDWHPTLAETPEALADAAERVAGRRILVVEDNPLNRLVVQQLLARRGATVLVTSNCLDALDRLAQEPVDLVLMDLQLPRMSGFDATARIRDMDWERGTHTPVIALTAHSLAGERERCLAAGMDGYVSKPFGIDTLLNEINRVLSRLAPAMQAGPAAAEPEAVAAPQALLGQAAQARFGAALDALGGDGELLVKAGRVWLDEHPGRCEQIREAAENGDWDELHDRVHTMKYAWSLFSRQADAGLPAELLDGLKKRDYEKARTLSMKLIDAAQAAAEDVRGALPEAAVHV